MEGDKYLQARSLVVVLSGFHVCHVSQGNNTPEVTKYQQLEDSTGFKVQLPLNHI